MKFGGSSLADYDRLDHVARLVVSQITTAGYQPRAIVCSAMGKTTNNLLAAGQAALQRPNQLLAGGNENGDADYMQYMTAIRALHMSVIELFEFL
jgi:aspartokinase